MTPSDTHDTSVAVQDFALIVGGGPGVSSSCARLFARSGMRVAIAARTPDKPVQDALEASHGVRRYACDAIEPADVETLFQDMADPDHIAELYLQLHRQHRSTWAFEVVLRPWTEKW